MRCRSGRKGKKGGKPRDKVAITLQSVLGVRYFLTRLSHAFNAFIAPCRAAILCELCPTSYRFSAHFPRDFHARIGNNPLAPPAPKTRVKNARLLFRDAMFRQSPVAARVNSEYRDKRDDCSNFFELTFCNARLFANGDSDESIKRTSCSRFALFFLPFSLPLSLSLSLSLYPHYVSGLHLRLCLAARPDTVNSLSRALAADKVARLHCGLLACNQYLFLPRARANPGPARY
jgi:hypothetical protein